ncbi:Uncharacterized conserved protein YbjT, contains NAD(P)-binding and DUF2867 domains [Actinopolymorpha cephalotaxi]|uniref:Uncharacterized conserved protein YbjT, contains NAD(P)-binding and DUF2867 domains n=1 Tax=Actinopolymorpha cephalotaxi TaxID=504797 RepID=A0A1I3AWW6_9ACTN|nr:NmrA family transcriptional regulator [Actinopolymorpha cephalotaxi]NYH84311.1 uncharacterized protein YbjT (DUF2867 family) [Actinopolymorpha cephalotaxi]SFH54608.1 Uncharacterized conserved protein YbjT, contains NAD(P)-binding and DUF2867 domains [Actinopolymorpha cephalotaxi]
MTQTPQNVDQHEDQHQDQFQHQMPAPAHPNLGAAGTTLVLAGTGKTGARVARLLAARGASVRIGSRSAQPSFDWEDPGTWPAAIEGVSAAYVAYVPDLGFPGAAETVGAFARLAVDHGVRRLVLLSGRGEPEAQRTERALRDACGESASWTVVRSSFFAQNFSEGFLADAVRAGVLPFPAGDVAEPFVDADDVADVAVAALTEPGHEGQVYEVTGPRSLRFAEVAAEISAASGREVTYAPVTVEQFAAGLVEEGVPAEFAALLSGLFGEVLDGRNAGLTDGVQRALGREPRDFSAYVRSPTALATWTS